MAQASVQLAVGAVGLASLLALNGCSVGMALSGEKGANLQALEIGSTRGEVEGQLGTAISQLKDSEDGRIDLYEYALHKPPNIDNAIAHAFMDMATLGVWELVGTPMEAGEGTTCQVMVHYGPNDRVADTNQVGCETRDLCPPCSITWQDSRAITPISYQRSPKQRKRSVGRLRQLAIAPVRYEHVRYGTPLSAQGAAQEWSSEAFKILGGRKGYELVPVGLYEDILCEKLSVTPDEVHGYMDVLVKWAEESPHGALPPEEIMTIVSRLGRALNVDGLVVIQGRKREGFFTLHSDVGADVYEVATGRIVWRGRRRNRFDSAVIGDLFRPLEQAVPRFLVQE